MQDEAIHCKVGNEHVCSEVIKEIIPLTTTWTVVFGSLLLQYRFDSAQVHHEMPNDLKLENLENEEILSKC